MDGVSLHGLTNQEVLEVMKRTGQTVVLSVVRKKPRGLERSLDKGRQTVRHSTGDQGCNSLLINLTDFPVKQETSCVQQSKL